MNSAFIDLLPWIIPPLAGAAIGYITNWLAIKMLFRPLTEKRFLGIHIPFTPGIIPRQRYNLSDSIARMVSGRLLTEDAIKNQIDSENFYLGLYDNVSNATEGVLSRNVGEILSTRENREANRSSTEETAYQGREEVRGLVRNLVEGFFRSEGFSLLIYNVIERGVDFVYQLKLSTVFASFKDPQQGLAGLVETVVSDRNEERILEWVDGVVSERVQNTSSMGGFLPENIDSIAGSVFDYFYPSLYEAFIAWLKKPDTRHDMEKRGKVLVRDIVDQLTPLQRFVVSAAKYDLTIEERMPYIVDDLIQRLEEAGADPSVRERIATMVQNGVVSLRQKRLQEIGTDTPQKVQYAVHVIAKMVLERINTPEAKMKIVHFMEEELFKYEGKTIGEILERFFNLDREKATAYLSTHLTNFLIRKGGDIGTGSFTIIRDVLDGHREKTIGQLFGIDESRKIEMDAYLAQRVQKILDTRVPQIVKNFNVHNLVIEKINSLDMQNVEGLLLMVIEKHLKWINIFGALLGSLIGFMQVIINKLL